ncbi:MAG: thiol peroxidase [Planctomycetota bacterium]|jgi:thiol peroxidase
MEDTRTAITFKGNPLTLTADQPKVGEPAPDFEVLSGNLSAVKLSAFQPKVCVVCSVPSLDTPVCDTEVRKFNEHAASLGDDVVVLVISMDLPFAQQRWCGTAGVKNTLVLSDHRGAEFGTGYGVLIKELRLLARAVFVVDKDGVIRYIEVVDELTSEPDYEAALETVRELQR